MLSEKIIDLLVCFVAFVVFAIVVSIYPEEMFALLILFNALACEINSLHTASAAAE